MKKRIIIFSVSLFVSYFGANAQCTIDNTVTNTGVYPDTTVGLPPAYINTAYGSTLQVKVPADTVTQLGTFTVNSVHIDSIGGLPIGMSYSTNPTSGFIAGGANGCIEITGTALSGAELGGPGNNGIYPIIIYTTANFSVFSVPTDFPYNYEGYKIAVINNASINNDEILSSLVIFPNPASGVINFKYESPVVSELELQLLDGLGRVVLSQNANLIQGENTVPLSTDQLAPGNYYFKFKTQQGVRVDKVYVTR